MRGISHSPGSSSGGVGRGRCAQSGRGADGGLPGGENVGRLAIEQGQVRLRAQQCEQGLIDRHRV
ncbi:hypothetical protein GQF42_01760 [Streptomyces broussonetiae]|uniref:Uncharacterized protein n=1 Tax=Streptomyces broussonetiae TaxID=2686304 RepID=A0A6I6MRY2_9ACTN|nr:hypothetical protein [Streptomyces broussonetiae]QHA02222.1 hypothetical protein GQF42_01760 [Streptomyces broussonetiae]